MTATLLDVDADGGPVVRCKDCHRALTDPASRSRPDGPQGPDCWEKEHGAPPSRPVRRTRTPVDQPALPLDLPEPVPAEREFPTVGHVEAFRMITERERPAAIRAALDEHGMPDHLWGLVGWLYGVARDVPDHGRPAGYREVMGMVADLFNDHDPANTAGRYGTAEWLASVDAPLFPPKEGAQ